MLKKEFCDQSEESDECLNDGILQYQIENKYLREQLVLAKNAFYFAKNKIKELENILGNVSDKIDELENEISNQVIHTKKKYKNNDREVKIQIEPQNVKKVFEPTPKRSKQNKRKYPEHEMYKYVIQTSEK